MRALHAARHDAAPEEVVSFLEDGSGRVLDVAHIGVLTLQSPVLRAMLGTAMREARTSEVRVQQEFARHWPQVVRFLYGLRAQLDGFDAAIALRRAAQYYDLRELAEASSEALLLAERSPARALALLADADFDNRLAEHALAHVDARPKDLFESPEWLDAHSATVKLIVDRDELRCDELQIARALHAWGNRRGHEHVGDTPSPKELPNSKRRKCSETVSASSPSCPHRKLTLLDLFDCVRFENVTPQELRSIKDLLPAVSYTSALERLCGVSPKRDSRPVRKPPPTIFRCSSCAEEISVEDEDVEAIPRTYTSVCSWVHTGKLIAEDCPHHRGSCACCPLCNQAIWSCCLRGRSSGGCVRNMHKWVEVKERVRVSHATERGSS